MKSPVRSLLILSPEYVDTYITEAKKRINEYFAQNQEVKVNFSFGKDSLLLTLLCYEVASQRNELHKLVLQTVELDDFLLHDKAIEWSTYVKSRLPIKWELFRPTLITHPVVLVIGLGQYAPNPLLPRCPWKNIYKTRALTDKNSLLGLREDESNRRTKILRNAGSLFYVPIHDIPEELLWKYLENNIHKIEINYDRLVDFYRNKQRDGCLFCPFNLEGYDHPWQYELVSRYRFFRDMLIKNNILDRPILRTKFLAPPRIPFQFRYTYLSDEIRAIERKFDVTIVTEDLQKILDEIHQFYTLYGEVYCWSTVKERYEEYLQYALYPDTFKSWFATNAKGQRVIVWHNKTNVTNPNNETLYQDNNQSKEAR